MYFHPDAGVLRRDPLHSRQRLSGGRRLLKRRREHGILCDPDLSVLLGVPGDPAARRAYFRDGADGFFPGDCRQTASGFRSGRGLCGYLWFRIRERGASGLPGRFPRTDHRHRSADHFEEPRACHLRIRPGIL